MPPKLSKKEQEELARQEEERKQREEAERLRKEAEENKKYAPQILSTGLECILTEYYVKNVIKTKNPRQFTEEFIIRYLQKQQIRCNFRDFDIQMLVEFNLHNIYFALQNHFNQNELYIFINIMWHLLMTGNPRLVPYREKNIDESEKDFELGVKKHISAQKVTKSSQNDLQLLQQLLQKHSSDTCENQKKIFTPKALNLIINYAKSSYFAHYNLYQFVTLNDQQNLDLFETIFVDEPQPIIQGLDNAIYEPLDQQQNENQQQQDQQQQDQGNQDQEQNGDEEEEEEEEEELDPVSQQIVQQKIKEAQQNIEQQLLERELQHKAKIEELSQPKKKK